MQSSFGLHFFLKIKPSPLYVMDIIVLSDLFENKVLNRHKIRNLSGSIVITDNTRPIAIIKPYKNNTKYWKETMTLKENINSIKELIEQMSVDLEKASNGNKAASQRVRTASIKLEKLAKDYRRLSIEEQKAQEAKKKS